MWNEIHPSRLDFAKRSPFRVEAETVVNASAESIFELLSGDWERWHPDLLLSKWIEPTADGLGSQRIVEFREYSARQRVVAWEPAKHLAFSIDAVTLPLFKEMIEEIEIHALGPGRARVEWRCHYDPSGIMRVVHPLARLIFERLIRNGLGGLEKNAPKRIEAQLF